jgi:cellulose synthase/poly-beta-1,6-N-acetylglucosamine synthase-like glycosyltransferase
MRKICALIPAYNEQIVVGPTLQSLLDCGFDPTDIFIIDDHSTDNTYTEALKYTPNVIRLEVNKGKAGAQTAAVARFELLYKYEYVIMMDCDSKVNEDFRDILYTNAYLYPDVSLFVGQVKNARSDSIVSAIRAVEYTFSHSIIKKGQDNFGVIYVAPGCASMYSTKMLSQLHFDSSTLAEDMDLTIQVHLLDGKVKYVHEAEVITQDPGNLTDYHKQIMRWFRGFWQIVDKYKVLKFGLKHRINYYMMYIIFDGLFLNRIFLILLSMFFLPIQYVALGLTLDFIVFVLIAIFSAFKTKRFDVIYKTPLIYFSFILNTYAFIRSFIEVILQRKKTFGWNKVTRYVEE